MTAASDNTSVFVYWHSPPFSAMVMNCKQSSESVHSRCSQVEPLMRLAGIFPLMWLSLYEDVPFQTGLPGNGVSCVCVWELLLCDLSGILINLVNEHQTAFCVCVFGCDHDCCLLHRLRFQLDRDGWCSDSGVGISGNYGENWKTQHT